MLASYALSRTLTPVMIGLLLKGEHHGGGAGSRHWFWGFLHRGGHGVLCALADADAGHDRPAAQGRAPRRERWLAQLVRAFSPAVRAWLRAVSPRLPAGPHDVAQAAAHHPDRRRADAGTGRRDAHRG